MHFSTTSLVAVLAGLANVQGHMLLEHPIPYGKSSLNNGPLAADGSDYPCKQRPGVYDTQGANNVMSLGSTQPLSFTGSAVHGGGSCQVSITYDKNPTKDSVFKVIHSIVGGCPAKGVDGNLPSDPNGHGASGYSFKIPEDLPTGEATIAWTWFNKVGNREMYMNCAPVTITGAGGASTATKKARRDQSALAKLPDMFKANIGNGCTTADSKNLDFPAPGGSVEKDGSGAASPPVGNCGSGSTPAAGTGSGSNGGPYRAPADEAGRGSNGGAYGVSSSPPATTAVVATTLISSAPKNTGGAFVGGMARSSATQAYASQPALTNNPAATATTTGTSPTTTGSSGGDGGSGSGSTSAGASDGNSTGGQKGPCAAEGAFLCLAGGKSFQQCGSGRWSAVMQMAAGTSCARQAVGQPDTAVDGSYSKPHRKRHIRFSHGHLQRFQDSSP